MLGFETGVNFTAGLSLVRTSPDHGTAFDIAADLPKLRQAIFHCDDLNFSPLQRCFLYTLIVIMLPLMLRLGSAAGLPTAHHSAQRRGRATPRVGGG